MLLKDCFRAARGVGSQCPVTQGDCHQVPSRLLLSLLSSLGFEVLEGKKFYLISFHLRTFPICLTFFLLLKGPGIFLKDTVFELVETSVLIAFISLKKDGVG